MLNTLELLPLQSPVWTIATVGEFATALGRSACLFAHRGKTSKSAVEADGVKPRAAPQIAERARSGSAKTLIPHTDLLRARSAS